MPACEAARLFRGIKGWSFTDDGSLQLGDSRHEALNTVKAILSRDCDVTIQADGLESLTLPRELRAVLDFAIDAGVPVQFAYRDRLLRVTAPPEG